MKKRISANKVEVVHSIEDWVFNYSEITKTWRATTREHYKDLFNNYNSPNVIKSSKFSTLESLIHLTGGNIKEMNKLAK